MNTSWDREVAKVGVSWDRYWHKIWMTVLKIFWDSAVKSPGLKITLNLPGDASNRDKKQTNLLNYCDMVEKHWTGNWDNWLSVLTLPLTSYVTLGKICTISRVRVFSTINEEIELQHNPNPWAWAKNENGAHIYSYIELGVQWDMLSIKILQYVTT